MNAKATQKGNELFLKIVGSDKKTKMIFFKLKKIRFPC